MTYTVNIEVYGNMVSSVTATPNTPALLVDAIKSEVKYYYRKQSQNNG